MTATAYTMCEQLGRHWAAETAWPGGLAFVEPGQTGPGNLYAAPLPERAHRLELAASITPLAATALEPSRPQEVIGVAIEAHAPTPRRAVELAADLVRVLFPSRRPFAAPGTRAGVDVSNVIGWPALAAGQSVELWRVIEIQRLTGPVWVPRELATSRSEAGQSLATLTLEIQAVPLAWTEPE